MRLPVVGVPGSLPLHGAVLGTRAALACSHASPRRMSPQATTTCALACPKLIIELPSDAFEEELERER